MLIGYLVCKMGWLHLNKITIGTTFMKLSASWWKCSRCKLRLEIRDRFGSCEWKKKKIFRDNGAKSEKMWMSRRSEMVGWRERSCCCCCALSGGRRRVRWRRGGRTISAGTGAQDRRRSAGYRSTLPFFLHNDTETHAERQVSQPNSRLVS